VDIERYLGLCRLVKEALKGMNRHRIPLSKAWFIGFIGMSNGLGVRSKQLLALCSILFTVYCLLSFLAVAAPVSADTVEPEWVARYDSPEDGHDEARAIVVDTAGYIYVSGDSSIIGTSTGTRDYFTTIKYDPAGHPLWIARYATWGSGTRFPHWVKGLAVDKEGNVYVTGNTGNDYSNDYVTIKYDPNGKQLWVAQYNGPANGLDIASALAIDEVGNVYITGGSEGDYATIKYDPDGHQLWVARYDGGAGDWARKLAIGDRGNIYVTGLSYGGGSSGIDYLTIKYDPDGNQLWVARYNGLGNGMDYPGALAIDSRGNVYVTGYSNKGNGTGEYHTTVKYDSDGNQLWVASLPGAFLSSYDNAIVVDNDGNVYMTGAIRSNNGYSDYATVKYDSSGHQLWVASYRGADKSDNLPTAMALDNVGNVYVTGVSGSDYATVKYNSEGHQLWVARYNGPANLDDRPSALVVDGSGNIYVTGNSRGDNYKSDYATVKYRQEAEIKSSINQTTFGKGDTLTWDVIIGGSDRVDVYLAVVLPSGDFICLADTQVNTSAYNTAIPILQDWPIQTGTYRIISYPFNGKEPRGEYQLYIVFTKPRANPLDRSKWVIYDASSFIVP